MTVDLVAGGCCDPGVLTTTVDATGVAPRVLRLPKPTTALAGALEVCGWVLLHRAAPFDPVLQLRLATEWGLSAPTVLTGRAAALVVEGQAAATARGRAEVLRRLQRLARGCPPPAVLAAAVRLARDAPWLTDAGLREALLLARLSHGEAGAALMRALADLWGVAVAGSAAWPDAAGEQRLTTLAGQVRRSGVLVAPEPPAGERLWLLEKARVLWSGGHLVAAGDLRSGFGRAVRRQLAAVGPLPSAVLGQGARRDGPQVVCSSGPAVLAWASAQLDLQVRDGWVAPAAGTADWLLASDAAVLALAPDAGGELARREVLAALVGHGMTGPSAEVWLSHCPWLRSAGRRGRYRRAA